MKIWILLLLSTCAILDGMSIIDPYVKFVRRLFFSPADLKYSKAVIFDRNQGDVNRKHYQRAYGYQGQNLIEAYGKGLSVEQLRDLGYL